MRRLWLAEFAQRKTSPRGVAGWVAATIAGRSHPARCATKRSHDFGHELLTDQPFPAWGQPDPRLTMTEQASDARAAHITLVRLLAAHGDTVSTHSWRIVDRDTTRYRPLPRRVRYGLREIEQRAAGQDPLPVPGDVVDSNARADPDPDDRSA